MLGIRKFYGEGLVEDRAKVTLAEIEHTDTRSMIKLLEKFKQDEQWVRHKVLRPINDELIEEK